MRFFPKRKCKLDKRQISRFSTQLQMLLSSGVPLLSSLRIIQNMSKHEGYQNIIQKIEQGETLASALEEDFPPMVISSIEGAESAGNLEEVLGGLSKYYEDRAEVEEKIKSALIYPCFVVVLCIISLAVIFLFVLPGFKSLFADLGADLPLFTRILIGIGDVFQRAWYLPILSFAAAGIALRRCEKLDRLTFKLKFLRQEMIIQSFRTLGSLLRGGVPIVEALITTARTAKNEVFREIILNVKNAIEEGNRLSGALSSYKIFPKEALQMIAVGENSGNLAEMLLNIADFYEKEREVFIKRFTSMLEPMLTLFVGLMVGIIAMAMFLPMVNMISKLQ